MKRGRSRRRDPGLRTLQDGLAALAVAAGLCLTACEAAEKPTAAPAADPESRPDVVLIVVDTLRRDRVSAYGYPRSTTPQVDALAALGLRFQRAFSQSSWTAPSMASLLSSRYPTELGIENEQSRLPDEVALLPELLHEAGYATGAAVSHSFCSSRWGFDQGFEVFDESQIAGHTGISSEGVSEAGLRFIDANLDRPFFLLLHYFDPHIAFQEHPGFDFKGEGPAYSGVIRPGMRPNELRQARPGLEAADLKELARLYDSEIAFTDHHIGRVLEHLRAVGRFDSALIVFTADHGEEFLDHGRFGHAKTLFNELVNVPLILKLPASEKRRPPAGLAERPVALLDVAPTIADVLGIAEGRDWRGSSLLDPTAGDEREIFMETSRRRKLRAMVRGDHKLVHNTKTDRYELYDLAGDPGEQRAESGLSSELARDLASRLDAWASTHRPIISGEASVEISESERERLRALGYAE